MAMETFKILNEIAPPVLTNLVRLRDNSVYNFRYMYNNILQVPQVRTTKYGPMEQLPRRIQTGKQL